jgi:cytoskeletal protein CcmA (bactofilin family)
MFFNRKKQPPIKSLIALGTQIKGDILFADGVRIDGEVLGNITASEGQSSILVVSETAAITGEIHADHVIVNGRVTGPIHARDLLELQPKAVIQGDVHYKGLEMHQGATISGQLRPFATVVEATPVLKLAGKNSEK